MAFENRSAGAKDNEVRMATEFRTSPGDDAKAFFHAASLNCNECGVESRVIAHDLAKTKEVKTCHLRGGRHFGRLCPHRCLACWGGVDKWPKLSLMRLTKSVPKIPYAMHSMTLHYLQQRPQVRNGFPCLGCKA